MQEKEGMKNIRDLELIELKSLCKEEGFPAYRAEQLFSWLHEKAVEEYTEMTNIPKAMREKLAEGTAHPAAHLGGNAGGVSMLIPHENRFYFMPVR